MNTFGLGLVISLKDDATAAINNVVQSFLHMENTITKSTDNLNSAVESSMGRNLYRLGDDFIDVGKKVTGFFTGIINNIKNTGQEFENFRITLGAIYKDESIVETKLQQLFDFSVKSPFEVSDTKDMLIVLKSIGVDAFEQLTSASTGFQQEGLSWITDLMSFKPDVAVTRWKLALTNFLGSGEAKVLRNILDSGKIEDIIGREVADTAEGRMQDLMDIATNLGLEGLTEKLSGTLETKISNIGDFFTQFYNSIADEGAFQRFKRMYSNLTDFLIGENMTQERLKKLAHTVSNALDFILTPLERLTEKFKELSNKATEFLTNHPGFMKIATAIVSITGVSIILLGVISKLGGATITFLSSLKYLSGGAGALAYIKTGLLSILKLFGPLALAAYLFYRAWDMNIFGIKDIIKEQVREIIDTMTLLWDALSDDTLSEEAFEKARKMGILPFIESVLQLKYHWGFLVKGFKKGLDDIAIGIGKFLEKLGILDMRFSNFRDMLTKVFEKMTAPGMTNTWEKIGESIPKLILRFVLLRQAISLVGKGLSIFKSTSEGLSALSGVADRIFGSKKQGESPVTDIVPYVDDKGKKKKSTSKKKSSTNVLDMLGLSEPVKVIKSLASVGMILVAMTAFVKILGRLNSSPEAQELLSSGFSVIRQMFVNLIPLISTLVLVTGAFKVLELMKINVKGILKGLAETAVLLIGLSAVIGVLGMLTSSSAVTNFISSGIDTLKQLVEALSVFATPGFIITLLAVAALGMLGTEAVLSGLLALATLIGGLSLIILAFGALSQIPGFTDFMAFGGEALSMLFEALESIASKGFITGLLAVAVLGTIGIEAVAAGLVALAVLLGGFEAIIAAFATLSQIPGYSEFMSSGEEALKQLMGILEAFASKGFITSLVAVSVLGMLGVETIIPGLVAVATLLGGFEVIIAAFAALAKIPGYSEFMNGGGEALKQLFGILESFASKGFITSVVVLTVLSALGGFIIPGFTALATLLGGFELIVAAFGALSKIPGYSNFMSGGGEALAQLFECLSFMGTPTFLISIAAIAALGLMTVATVASGLVALAALIGGFEAVIAAFAALAQIPGYFEFMETGGEALCQLFSIIGEVAGSVVGGFAIGVTDALPAIGTNIADFATNLKPLFEVMKDADAKSVGNFLVSLGEFLLMMSADELLGFIKGETDLEKVGSQITLFADKAKGFFTKVANYPAEGIEKAPKVFEALKGMGDSAFKFGGFEGIMNGDTDLGKIGGQLKDFAEPAENFFKFAAGVSTEGIENAPKIFKALEGMGNSAFKFDGFKQIITGETSLTKIGKQLEAFSPSIATFLETIKGYSDGQINKAEQVINFLSVIGDAGLKSGKIRDLIKGEINLADIGVKLTAYAEKLKSFFDIVDKFKAEDIYKGTVCVEFLETLGNLDFFNGFLGSILNGNNDLANLAHQLASFGPGAAIFFRSMRVFDTETFNKGKQAIEVLNALNSSTYKSGGLLQAFTGKVDFAALAQNLGVFGVKSQIFFATVKNIDSSSFDKAAQLFNALSTMKSVALIALSLKGNTLLTFGKSIVVFADNLILFYSKINSIETGKLSTVTSELTPFFQAFNDFNMGQLLKIPSGIDNVTNSTVNFDKALGNTAKDVKTNTSNIVMLITGMCTKCVQVLDSLANQGTRVGYNLMNSLANSIASNSHLIGIALRDAVNAASASIPPITANVTGGTVKNTSAVKTNTKMIGLSTGGYVNTTGIAVLHPNEVVINDEITQNLRTFLSDYTSSNKLFSKPILEGLTENLEKKKDNYISYPVVQQSVIATDDYSENRPVTVLIDGDDKDNKPKPTNQGSPIQRFVDNSVHNSTTNENSESSSSNVTNDNKVIFENGSIVFNVQSTENGHISKSELEKCANELMQIMSRKMQLRGLQTRK